MKQLGGKVIQFMLAVLVGGVAAYFAVSFLSNFYTSIFSFVLFSVLFSIPFTLTAFFLIGETIGAVRAKWRMEIIGLLVLAVAGGLAFATVRLGWQFPMLFDRRILFMDAASMPLFAGLALASAGVSAPVLVFLTRRGYVDRLFASRAWRFVRENLGGLLLAVLFFFTYFTLAETVNFPGFSTRDQYFDLDISDWLARLQAASPRAVTDVVRAVHPAVLLFLRPTVWFVSLFLNGDRLHAIFIVHALAAAACVFLTWRIVKRAAGSTTYALIMASLLGGSAAHLLLGSMLETYIYSALALLFFVSLLQNESVSLKVTVPAGVLVFGITVTNLAQTAILYFAKHPRFKVVFKYILLVLGLVLVLNALQVWIYPAAAPLTPHNLVREQGYGFDTTEASWRLTGRVSLTTRAVLLYGMLAPKPFVLMEELGMNVPNFRTFEITVGEFHVAGYVGLADIAIKLWMLILVAAIVFFVWGWFENPKPMLSLGPLVCLGFNFALHVLYGDDPMLYSPDWVYALVLFTAFSFARFAEKNWFQFALVVFLVLLMFVNLGLMRQIMEVSAPFYGR